MHGFSRQEHWSGLPCSAPEGLPNPGLEPTSPVAPALQADSLPMSPWGSLLKADNYVLFGGHSEDCKARRQNSWMVLRDHSEEVKKKPKYIGAFATKTRYPALQKKKEENHFFFFAAWGLFDVVHRPFTGVHRLSSGCGQQGLLFLVVRRPLGAVLLLSRSVGSRCPGFTSPGEWM